MEISLKHPSDFNLIAPEYLAKIKWRRIKISGLIAMTAMITVATLSNYFFNIPANYLKSTQEHLSPPLNLSDKIWHKLNTRVQLSDVFHTLAEQSKNRVWLSSISYHDEKRALTLFGQGYTTETIIEFAQGFQEHGKIKNGKISSFTQDEGLVRFKWEGNLPQ